MSKIYKRKCNYCGKYYEGAGKFYCSYKCLGKSVGFQKGNQLAKNHLPNKTSFKKGQIPWNKGKKGLMPAPWNKGLKGYSNEKMKGHPNWNTGRTWFKKGQTLGKNHPMWKGGRVKHRGYYYIYAKGHPFAKQGIYIFEHRFIAEKCLGRYLTREERIHHINGKKDDNRPENLYLFSSEKEHRKYHNNPYSLKSNLTPLSILTQTHS